VAGDGLCQSRLVKPNRRASKRFGEASVRSAQVIEGRSIDVKHREVHFVFTIWGMARLV
jgi:hypothetical protein